jgi:hypothetical protein
MPDRNSALLRAALRGLILLLALACGTAQATLVFDNSTAASAGSDSVASAGPIGQSFTTDGSGFSLKEIALDLASSGASTTGAVVVTLETAATGGTATPLATIAASALSGSLGLFDITLDTPVALAASTQYWIELATSGTAADPIVWSYSLDTSGTGVAGQFTYNSYNNAGAPGIADATNGLYQMCLSSAANVCVTTTTTNSGSSGSGGGSGPPSPPGSPPATDTPEPPGLAILLAALAGLGVLRRRAPAG